MPIETNPVVDYIVTTTAQGEYVEVKVFSPDDSLLALWSWYPYAHDPDLFTEDTARDWLADVAGMSERQRNKVVKLINFEALATNE